MLSLKIATDNIKNGFKSFAPFLMASVTMFVMVFVTASIGFSPSINHLRGGAAVSTLMKFALAILTIFSLMILIYSYRFLQLQRSKEFGLYDILGFGKRKIVSVAFLELFISYLLTIIIGTICGVIFSKFLFLVFVNLIGGNYFDLQISFNTILFVSFVYLVFFFILIFIGALIIWKSSSLDLLREASKGEKEPKSNLFLAALALVFLGSGYFLALTVEDPISAITRFFIAVLLVIFGTYFFYISFTIWYLKRKKKRPSYYKASNFITTSSMLYRMKANAAGLANITILLSMTVVTIVVSLGIFLGSEKMVKEAMPKDAMISAIDPTSKQDLTGLAQTAADVSHTQLSDLSNLYIAQDIGLHLQNTHHKLVASDVQTSDKDDYTLVTMVTRDSLVSSGNDNLPPLSNNQIVIKDTSNKPDSESKNLINLDWYDNKYDIIKYIDDVKNLPRGNSFQKSLLVVFPNKEEMNKVIQSFNERENNQNYQQTPTSLVLFNIDKSEEKAFSRSFKDITSPSSDQTLTFRSEALADQHAQIGGFVFIGFVLGVSFILGAALIIYYKQLSEGTQDKRSFKILQEVGLSKEEVQKTIQSQVRMIFFLPLIIAVLHFIGAYRMIANILNMFGANDFQLVFTISALTLLGCMVIYYFIYRLTSKVYYNIVER
ncbi:ABC transporter permease [Lactococcus lactis]